MLLTGIKIENYRGIKNVELALDQTTVLIGENNCGKTSILHALRACLAILRPSGGGPPFEELDLHFDGPSASPETASPIVITMTFQEPASPDWSENVVKRLSVDSGIIALTNDNRNRVQLQVVGQYSKATQEIETTFDFLDAAGNALPAQSRARLTDLQQLRPLFYLSALRDSAKEFSRASQFWSPFAKNSQIDEATKDAIEKQLDEINGRIIEAHGAFKGVREYLTRIQELVALGTDEAVSVDAVPGRLFDLLSRTQVSVASATGAKLPIARHGEGTQSLSVLMLFDAFLKSEMARRPGYQESIPIVALEEPEAHLHPNAVRALWKTIRDIDGQKLIATHSGDLLSEVDLSSIRRIYKASGNVKIGAISAEVLREREENKFDFLVRRTRGELFFARCWLLGEGETEAILFAGAATVLGLDLSQAGVRCVEYRSGDIGFFLDAANALGIHWHCLTDADQQGAIDKAKAVERILDTNAPQEQHISVLENATSIEPYLAKNGFLDVLEQCVSRQKWEKNVKVSREHAEYAEQVASCVTDKPAAAHAIVRAMIERGPDSVPAALRTAILKSVELAGRN